MTLSAIVLICMFVVAMLLGVPISWSLGLSCVSAVLLDPSVSLSMVPQKIFAGCDSFAMLAVPCFFLAGDVMAKGGLSKRLASFSNSIIGWVSGGLSLVALAACTFFAAVSGSSVATTAAIGSLLYPEMVKKGYPKDYSAAVQAIGGTLGIVIPPSIVFVIYGNITGVSVSKLLMAGVIPGILTGITLCIYAYVKARKNNFPKEKKATFKQFLISFKDAAWALVMPVIILGGIYLGIFTPTESSAIAVLYGVIVCFAVYREMTGKSIWEILRATALSTSNLMFLVVTAQVFGYLITYYKIPVYATNAFMSIASDANVFMFLIVLLLLLCGMFMDVGATNLILGPILAPIAVAFGVDPVHFGMVFVFLLALGQATPPFGTTMFVACSISGQPVSGVAKQIVPFILVEVACGLLFAYVPALSIILPNILIK